MGNSCGHPGHDQEVITEVVDPEEDLAMGTMLAISKGKPFVLIIAEEWNEETITGARMMVGPAYVTPAHAVTLMQRAISTLVHTQNPDSFTR